MLSMQPLLIDDFTRDGKIIVGVKLGADYLWSRLMNGMTIKYALPLILEIFKTKTTSI